MHICYFDSVPASQLPRDQVAEDKETAQHGSKIRCRQCQVEVTKLRYRYHHHGQHHHFCINPDGIEYEIVLFSQADCLLFGQATEEYTWFSGYQWRVALCHHCQVHLGWQYQSGNGPDFYGLILPRLIYSE